MSGVLRRPAPIRPLGPPRVGADCSTSFSRRPSQLRSTHILKPAVRELDDSTVDNEASCRHLVATAGLPAAITTIEEFAGVRGVTERLAKHTVNETAEAIRAALDHDEAPIESLRALVSHRLGWPTDDV